MKSIPWNYLFVDFGNIVGSLGKRLQMPSSLSQ
ncbi:hypothetical protein PC116_g20650 [Phytophthora cactorum]|nr:hypothetical protein PC114_g24657 [Phytophthora cactorum]KAG2968477.1 hypothetical protein PC119_g24202 [Phytophthora cactorum]KAG2987172.1 hypothetical protein PC120_g23664 [Phytophthora cactorum]KAG3144100.1 hypothetical protein C6341_g18848 [Phytophthora cactorum]KAG3149349.1 hypothetical protein PC128_g23427 [Phytophthora cactorum]